MTEITFTNDYLEKANNHAISSFKTYIETRSDIQIIDREYVNISNADIAFKYKDVTYVLLANRLIKETPKYNYTTVLVDGNDRSAVENVLFFNDGENIRFKLDLEFETALPITANLLFDEYFRRLENEKAA